MEYKRLTHRNHGCIEEYCEERHCIYCDKDGNCHFDKKSKHIDVSCDCFYAMAERLSELEDKIEQGTLKEEKTCKNISDMHPVDGFTCSECGISLEDYCEKEVDEENGDITYREYMFKYCPNCGAKAVDDE